MLFYEQNLPNISQKLKINNKILNKILKSLNPFSPNNYAVIAYCKYAKF